MWDIPGATKPRCDRRIDDNSLIKGGIVELLKLAESYDWESADSDHGQISSS